jgi:glycerol-3-phosphate dehydrogenase
VEARTVTDRRSQHPFSPAGRAHALREMATRALDVLVIGGGITGVGIARAAALRGWSVALVEKEDFAFGTSSRSSKIVHGGVRYLEYGHFLLVRESARERRVVQSIAPHLVHRLDFLYPVFEPDSLMKIRAGLAVFDWLASAEGAEKHRTVDPDEVREQIPGLRDPLRGAVLYPEYITDDARFTLENALSAAEHGALVANRARAEALYRDRSGRVKGARVRDVLDGTVYEVQARVVVNAGGPWAEEILQESGLSAPKHLRPSRGIHILLPASRLPMRGATFLKSTYGRRGLAMRRLDYVYVGTSDEEHTGPLDSPSATRAEVLDVLAMAQDSFPDAGLGLEDVLATWAGIRPLVAEPGKSTRDTSREDEVWSGPEGLVTIAGGKLTTYRRMAERVVDVLRDQLGGAPQDADLTADVPLPGAPAEDIGVFTEERARRLRTAGVPEPTVARLGWLYGRQLDSLLALGADDPSWLRPLGPGVPAVRGEVKLAVETEMASSLADFMDRRAALLLFSPRFGLEGAVEAAAIMGDALRWDAAEREQQIAAYRQIARAHGVPDS